MGFGAHQQLRLQGVGEESMTQVIGGAAQGGPGGNLSHAQEAAAKLLLRRGGSGNGMLAAESTGGGSGLNLPRLKWDLTRDYNEGSVGSLAGGPLKKIEYSRKDYEVATEEAKERALRGGQWLSVYSETGVQKRDFFQDLRRQRGRDKGKEASGPVWQHLAVCAKNLAQEMQLPELLEALKLFASVRHPDYDLYMRLLGEIPRFVMDAKAEQLCSMIRILARRRLRERNYVDMAAAHLLRKLRLTDDMLPPRLLVKAGNALASLECRSNPRFVEGFLRHCEHRIEELSPELCSQVSPPFVVNYMNDSVRRAYLTRCAETQAGFHPGGEENVRKLALTEFALRKEHHSLVASLQPFVVRYLEKLRQYCAFDGYSSVSLPTPATPAGPQGGQRDEMAKRLQMKVSITERKSQAPACPASSVDVFSSEMHRDVSACLGYLGVEHENGARCGPYLMDVVALDMVNPEKRIVYEVNAAHHFYEGTDELIAERKLRHRMLNRSGQKLIHVDAKEWENLSQAQRLTFLLQKQMGEQERNTSGKARGPLEIPRPRSSAGTAAVRMVPGAPLRSARSPVSVPRPRSVAENAPSRFTPRRF